MFPCPVFSFRDCTHKFLFLGYRSGRERESESEVEGKEVEGLSLVTLHERFFLCVWRCCVWGREIVCVCDARLVYFVCLNAKGMIILFECVYVCAVTYFFSTIICECWMEKMWLVIIFELDEIKRIEKYSYINMRKSQTHTHSHYWNTQTTHTHTHKFSIYNPMEVVVAW